MELELDTGEYMLKQGDELIGEQLLSTEYALQNPAKRQRIDFEEEFSVNGPIQ
jgi:hypothetical protein